jgi:predicted dehydrogenase
MSRVKIGVIGCGTIAQIQHLPNLLDLHDQYDVRVVCDLSAKAAEYAAAKFHVPQAVTDYRAVLDADVDAVLHCAGGHKTPVVVDVLQAGKHLFVEKPLCASLPEVDQMVAARQAAGVVAQVGYMKLYDPAFEVAQAEVGGMSEPRFIQINHMHPANSLHVGQFDVRRFDDAPHDVAKSQGLAYADAVRDAIGEVEPHVLRAFGTLSGSMIHDLYGLRTLFGVPDRVVNVEVWRAGGAVSFTLAYANGARCVATWVDLPGLWDFRETLEAFADDRRVTLSYPTGFARGIQSSVVIQGVDGDGVTYQREPALPWEGAFSRELRHFHDCIVSGAQCRTPVESAREDVALIIDIVARYVEGA